MPLYLCGIMQKDLETMPAFMRIGVRNFCVESVHINTCLLYTSLGVTILAVQDYTKVYEAQGFGMAYAEALICAAGAGVGFLVAMLLFCRCV